MSEQDAIVESVVDQGGFHVESDAQFDQRRNRTVFFFSSRRRHTRSLCDWSSDVCSSDLPDMFLGAHVERVTGRRMHVWMGECHVHAGIEPVKLDAARRAHPDAELLIHPECGCTTSTLYRASSGDLGGTTTVVTSTEGMIHRAVESPASTFIVATEVGILHRLERFAPGKRFLPASAGAVCGFMKMITLPKVAA